MYKVKLKLDETLFKPRVSIKLQTPLASQPNGS